MPAMTTMSKPSKLVIVGTSAFAEIAFEYFTADSDYDVVGFSAERSYLGRNEMFEKPVVAFEDIERYFPAQSHAIFVAVTYGQLNRVRTRLALAGKSKGYRLASYVSSRAFLWRNATVGEHCFIFENNTVQPFVRIGNNVVLWSGNHIGHHSVIGDNCFISSHVVISGYVEIGQNCFAGVNATIANNVRIGADCVLGAGSCITRDIANDSVVKGQASDTAGNAKRLFKVKE
jgi:sugar O-acyltransferase (sialic acid O-acetyltransferase NeuD family)